MLEWRLSNSFQLIWPSVQSLILGCFQQQEKNAVQNGGRVMEQMGARPRGLMLAAPDLGPHWGEGWDVREPRGVKDLQQGGVREPGQRSKAQ